MVVILTNQQMIKPKVKEVEGEIEKTVSITDTAISNITEQKKPKIKATKEVKKEIVQEVKELSDKKLKKDDLIIFTW